MKEAAIVISGVELTKAQSMTVRCALEAFASDLDSRGLGNDERGKAMTAGYLASIDEIRALIFKTPTLAMDLRPGNVKSWTEIKTWELELKCGHVVPYQGASVPETVQCETCDDLESKR